MKKNILMLIGVLLIGYFSFGCASQDSSLYESGYTMYYQGAEGNGLVTDNYIPKETKVLNLIKELYTALQTSESNDYVSSIPKNIELESYDLDNQVLSMNFSSSYLDLSTTSEVILRASVVKTLVQIPEINAIKFNVEGQPLTNAVGEIIGDMTAEDFVEDITITENNTNIIETEIYYADETGEMLIGEISTLYYVKEKSVEMVILDKLIQGPTIEGSQRTVPENLKVIGVSTKDNICYVNLDKSFLNTVVNISAKVTIYSIVNSLCELSTVNKVQILVDGSSDYSFRETFSLINPFERNLDIVLNSYKIPTY